MNLTSLWLALFFGLSAVATVFTGCSTQGRSTGQYIDDKSLAYKVSSALSHNSEYKLNNVDVKAFKGNVQLSGFVSSEAQKEKAGEIAKNVEGVQSVENNITVKTSS